MARNAISVCMPTFNGERFLHAQLQSILSELEPWDEIIIVDDASCDGTIRILMDMEKSDKRIKLVINERNVGVVKAVEIALCLATNEFIFLSDQDDIWLPGKVERGLSRLIGTTAVAVLSNAEILVEDRRTGVLFFLLGYEPRFSIPAQLYKNDFIGCSMCFKKIILKTALPFPGRISMHDWWLGVNAIATGATIFDRAPSILYRRHASNASPSSRRGVVKIIQSRFYNFLSLFVLIFRFANRG